MAGESVNRTVVIDGEAGDLLAVFQQMQEASQDMGNAFQRVMEQNSDALDRMTRSMDGLLERMERMSRNMGQNRGGAGGGAFAGGFAGGMFGGMGSGIAGGVGAGLGIGAFLGVGALIGTSFQEGRKLDDARHNLKALYGTEINDTIGQGTNIGVSTSDLLSYQGQMSRMRGMGDSDSEDRRRTLRMLEAERAYGLGEGETMSLNSFARSGGDDSSRVIARLFDRAKDSELWNIRVGGDGKIEGLATLSEKIQHVTSMTGSMLQGSERANTSMIVDILGTFGGIQGDEFSGSRGLSTINAMDQGIRNSSNPFMEAEIMTALAEANPHLDAWELKKLKGQGIYGEGNLDAITKQAMKHGDMSHMFLDQMTGGTLSGPAVTKLDAAMKENPDMFKGLGGEDAAKKFKSFEKSTTARASEMTGNTAKVESQMQDILGSGGEGIINALSPKIKAILDKVENWINDGGLDSFFGMVNTVADVTESVAKDISATVDLIKEQGLFDAMKSYVDVVLKGNLSQFGIKEEDMQAANEASAKNKALGVSPATGGSGQKETDLSGVMTKQEAKELNQKIDEQNAKMVQFMERSMRAQEASSESLKQIVKLNQ